MATTKAAGGATLRDPPSLKARKKEAHYIVRALTAGTKDKAREVITSGRLYSDRSREAVLSSVKGMASAGDRWRKG